MLGFEIASSTGSPYSLRPSCAAKNSTPVCPVGRPLFGHFRVKLPVGQRVSFPAVRSKTPVGQVNEVLCKVICHNLCVLVQSILCFARWSRPVLRALPRSEERR